MCERFVTTATLKECFSSRLHVDCVSYLCIIYFCCPCDSKKPKEQNRSFTDLCLRV